MNRAQQVRIEQSYNQLLEQEAEFNRVFDERRRAGSIAGGRSSVDRNRLSVSERPRGSTPERVVKLPPPVPKDARGKDKRPDTPVPYYRRPRDDFVQ